MTAPRTFIKFRFPKLIYQKTCRIEKSKTRIPLKKEHSLNNCENKLSSLIAWYKKQQTVVTVGFDDL